MNMHIANSQIKAENEVTTPETQKVFDAYKALSPLERTRLLGLLRWEN